MAVVKAEEDDLRVSSKYEGGERYLQLNVPAGREGNKLRPLEMFVRGGLLPHFPEWDGTGLLNGMGGW